MSARPYRIEVGPGASPASVLAGLPVGGPVAALWGRWFGGGAVVLTEPVEVLALERAEDAYELLDRQPALDLAAPVDADLLGGGWLVALGYADGHSWAGFFDHLWRWRPGTGWRLESLGLAGRDAAVEASLERLRGQLRAPAVPAPPTFREPFAADEDARTTHLRGVESVIAGIERGEFYQLNLCTRLRSGLTSPAPGVAVQMFAAAADRLQPAYGALLDRGDGRALVSLSPELFLTEHDGRVVTAPIKGTSARAEDPTGAALAASVKDAAENVMITDLMRNDLSRVCRAGSVAVERLLELQRHPGVWHLVSTVAGRLQPGTRAGGLVRATFPPGSVTGAPKLAAMTGIAGTEPHDRGAYTGALGLFTPSSGAELSVLIRTFELDGDVVELGVGGGITVDSVAVREWYECLHKAEPLVSAVGAGLAPGLRIAPPPIPDALRAAGLIETLLGLDGEPVRAAAHLARLDRSCRELYGTGIPAELPERVRRIAAERLGRRRLRVLAVPGPDTLAITVENHPAGPSPDSVQLVRSDRPAWCWRHKWADRSTLVEPAAAAGEPLTLPYYLTPDGFLAETSRGNLVLRRPDGAWVSPPESEHVLPGVTRRDLLRSLRRSGETVRVDDVPVEALDTATAILHCSSIAGVVPVIAVDRRAVGPAQGTEVAGSAP